jgi:PST family polysaccharide transporter
MSLATGANVVRAVITAKVLAVYLGPSQLGILAQLLNFLGLIATIAPLGLTSAVPKLVAESHRDQRRLRSLIGTSLSLSLLSGLLIVALLAPGVGWISWQLTGRADYAWPVLILVLTIPLANLASVAQFVIQGLADVRRLTLTMVATAGATLILMVPGAIFYGLNGVVAAIALSTALQALFTGIGALRSLGPLGLRLRPTWSAAEARQLVRYGVVVWLGGTAMAASVLLVRTVAVRALGDYQNGLYQVVYLLSFQYATIFMNWMWAHVFPRVSAEPNASALLGLLNSTLRANILLTVPVFALTIALREPLITVLYSSSFLSAASMIPVQLLGDYARVLGWSFGVSLFARGFTGGHLVAVAAQSAAWVGLSAALLPALGIQAVPLGYALSSLLWPALMYPMARHWLRVKIEAPGAFLSIAGLAVLLAAIVLPWPAGIVAASLLPLWALLMRNRSHRRPA